MLKTCELYDFYVEEANVRERALSFYYDTIPLWTPRARRVALLYSSATMAPARRGRCVDGTFFRCLNAIGDTPRADLCYPTLRGRTLSTFFILVLHTRLILSLRLSFFILLLKLIRSTSACYQPSSSLLPRSPLLFQQTHPTCTWKTRLPL